MCSSCAHFRIVRNKAAEKVKEIGGYGPSGESPSPGPAAGDTPLLRHPAYSINNILGMSQAQQRHHQDANENILKRKRDDEGQYCFWSLAKTVSKFSIISEENRDLSNEMESEFKRARSQYSAYTSMWAGKWMAGAQGAEIKQEKAGLGETEASPTHSPYPAVSNTSSFPDTGAFPVTNYSNTGGQQQQAAYTALTAHSGSGEREMLQMSLQSNTDR